MMTKISSIKHGLLILSDAYNCLKFRLFLLFVIMIISGILEGLGLLLLFPLLAHFGIGDVTANFLVNYVIYLLNLLAIPDTLGALLFFIVFVFLLQVSTTFLKAWYQSECQTRYTEYWHRRLFSAYMRSTWMHLMRGKVSKRITAIISESGRISAALNLLLQMLNSIVSIIIYSIISFAAAWQIVLIMLGAGSVLYFITRPVSRRSRYIGEKVTEIAENLQQQTNEFLNNAKLIKATATEDKAISIFNQVAADFRNIYRNANIQPPLIVAIYMSIGYILLGLGIWMGVEIFNVNPAAILVAIYVFLRLYVQISNMQQYKESFALSYPALPNAKSQYEEASAEIDRLPITGQSLQENGPVNITIDSVLVKYGDTVALDHISAEIPHAAIIGITGSSGSGKSTLLDSIVGLTTLQSGKILIDGISLEKLNILEWRHSIGYVGQDTLLLNSSIAMNIGWGASNIDKNLIEQAARLANAHDFISKLDNGYETILGDHGMRLSGGQSQRIGLARALMRGKRLLLLDEATSALDSESENEIMKALEKLRGKVTIIMAAHRLSTLRLADSILILENGKIIEQGNWESLITNKGQFERLWKLQQSPPVKNETKL